MADIEEEKGLLFEDFLLRKFERIKDADRPELQCTDRAGDVLFKRLTELRDLVAREPGDEVSLLPSGYLRFL